MNWWSVRIDPLPLPQRLFPRPQDHGAEPLPSYQLWLPLIPDGRISLPLFRAEPARAKVVSLDERGERDGCIKLRDHQLFCAWSPGGGHRARELRIIGARFAPGEVIGLRPARGVIGLYRVGERVELP